MRRSVFPVVVLLLLRRRSEAVLCDSTRFKLAVARKMWSSQSLSAPRVYSRVKVSMLHVRYLCCRSVNVKLHPAQYINRPDSAHTTHFGTKAFELCASAINSKSSSIIKEAHVWLCIWCWVRATMRLIAGENINNKITSNKKRSKGKQMRAAISRESDDCEFSHVVKISETSSSAFCQSDTLIIIFSSLRQLLNNSTQDGCQFTRPSRWLPATFIDWHSMPMWNLKSLFFFTIYFSFLHFSFIHRARAREAHDDPSVIVVMSHPPAMVWMFDIFSLTVCCSSSPITSHRQSVVISSFSCTYSLVSHTKIKFNCSLTFGDGIQFELLYYIVRLCSVSIIISFSLTRRRRALNRTHTFFSCYFCVVSLTSFDRINFFRVVFSSVA